MPYSLRVIPLLLLILGGSGCDNLLKRKISSDESLIDLAREELLLVRNGLKMYQAVNDTSAYPYAGDMTSQSAITRLLDPYIDLPAPDDCPFTFAAYARVWEDTFVFVARARDTNRTWLKVTPDGMFWKDGEEWIPLLP